MIHATLLKGRTLELMARKKNVTFNDIAQYTHFSKTTISRYFNNPDSLTPENQQIISDALDKLNYKENKVAKILANGQTECRRPDPESLHELLFRDAESDSCFL